MLILLVLTGAYELALPRGGEAIVNLTIENQTDTALKEPWIFVFSKPDWLSVSPDSVITKSLAKGEKVEVQLRLRSEPPWFPGLREGDLRLRVLVRNGEVAPDFIELKVKEEPAEFASLVPWLISREYEFEHELTEHYDYYPIIFLHGMNATGESWFQPKWEEDYDDYTALEKLVDSQYHGYTLGSIWGNDRVLDRDESVYSTIGDIYPKRVIYVVEYYEKNYNPIYGEDDPQGVIGSNARIYPVEEGDKEAYDELRTKGEYAEILADQIREICAKTYSDKVHIVAHSMGGIVARAAIKYYDCENMVDRVLMLATPNNGCHYSEYQRWVIEMGNLYPDWMKSGEAAEVKAQDVIFTSTGAPGVEHWWYEWLNEGYWPGTVKYAVIAGDLNNKIFGLGPDDGVVDVWWVHWDPARFNATHHSAHSSGPPGALWFLGEWEARDQTSLIANEFTTEYIKSWVIDYDETRSGNVQIDEARMEMDRNGNVRVFIKTPDFNKILVITIEIWVLEEVLGWLAANYRAGISAGDDWYYFDLSLPDGPYEPRVYFGSLTVYNLNGVQCDTLIACEVE